MYMKRIVLSWAFALVTMAAWSAGSEVVRTEEDSVKAAGCEVYVHEMDSVAPSRVIAEVLAKNRGRVVLVDMWATWCGPCRMGHRSMAPLKEELKDQPVVFAYLTNDSSPMDVWSEMIRDIPGQHYYLSRPQFSYILSFLYESQGIPTYALYDKQGNKVWQHIGYMESNEAVKAAILAAMEN